MKNLGKVIDKVDRLDKIRKGQNKGKPIHWFMLVFEEICTLNAERTKATILGAGSRFVQEKTYNMVEIGMEVEWEE